MAKNLSCHHGAIHSWGFHSGSRTAIHLQTERPMHFAAHTRNTKIGGRRDTITYTKVQDTRLQPTIISCMTDHLVNTDHEDQDWVWWAKAGKTKDSLRTTCAFMWTKTTMLQPAFWIWLFGLVLRKSIKPPHNTTIIHPYPVLYYIPLRADAIQSGKEHS